MMLFETESEMMAQARRAVREGRPDDAQGILVNVVVHEPDNDEAWILLAETLSDPERKIECLERARRVNPRNPAIQRAIAELQASAAAAAFGQTLEAAASNGSPPGSASSTRPELAAPLLEQAELVARAIRMTTEPTATRQLGLDMVYILDQARRHDDTTTRRWARSAGRDALVKYERALTILITNLPLGDSQLAALREQRQRALELFR